MKKLVFRSGTVNSATATEYAQYKDAAKITYTPSGKRKPETLNIYGNKEDEGK